MVVATSADAFMPLLPALLLAARGAARAAFACLMMRAAAYVTPAAPLRCCCSAAGVADALMIAYRYSRRPFSCRAVCKYAAYGDFAPPLMLRR